MKKLLLTSVILLYVISIHAQLDLNPANFNTEIKGYIISNDDTKKEGMIWYRHPLQMMDEVVFNGDEYKPGEIKGFSVDGTLWLSWDFKKDKLFLATSHVGAITVYHHFTLKDDQGKEITSYTEYNAGGRMQKSDGESVAVTGYLIGFKKKMSAFVSDFPELSEKIAKKEKGYGVLHFDKIVDEYNEWYAENNPAEKVTSVEAEVVSDISSDESGGMGIPSELIGSWQNDIVTMTIFHDKIIRNEAGDINRYYEGKITEYDIEKGFIVFKLYKVTSQGYDHSASYTDDYYIFYIGKITPDSIEIATPSGSGSVTGEYIHAYHDDTSRLWIEYTKNR